MTVHKNKEVDSDEVEVETQLLTASLIHEDLKFVTRFTFQLDNARWHMACVAMNYLQDCPTLPSPVRFPDLYPIEPIWVIVGRQFQLSLNDDGLAQQLRHE
ncbi:hypothetical protein TNCV_3264491 [Trichonephila clavipes]|nr:hypothetical protein TNCV_3264491 [Trichonephila clavipes]